MLPPLAPPLNVANLIAEPVLGSWSPELRPRKPSTVAPSSADGTVRVKTPAFAATIPHVPTCVPNADVGEASAPVELSRVEPGQSPTMSANPVPTPALN